MAILNIQRLEMEVQGYNINSMDLDVYLEENGLDPVADYDNTTATKIKIYKAALAALNSIANNPQYMQNYKIDTEEYSNFHINLRKRIEQLELSISSMKMESVSEQTTTGNVFFFYK